MIRKYPDWLKSKSIEFPERFNAFFISNWKTEKFVLSLYKVIFSSNNFNDKDLVRFKIAIWIDIFILAITSNIMFYLKYKGLI